MLSKALSKENTLNNATARLNNQSERDAGLAQDAALLAWVALQSMRSAGLAQDPAVLAWVAPRALAAAECQLPESGWEPVTAPGEPRREREPAMVAKELS